MARYRLYPGCNLKVSLPNANPINACLNHIPTYPYIILSSYHPYIPYISPTISRKSPGPTAVASRAEAEGVAALKLGLLGECLEKKCLGFPKIRGTFLGVPIIRTIVYWGLYWGTLVKFMGGS